MTIRCCGAQAVRDRHSDAVDYRLEAHGAQPAPALQQRVRNQLFLMRRAFVWKPKARFLDEKYLREHYPNHERDGAFPKNPKLRKFLVSGPASAAGLRFQPGFEAVNSRDACYARIEAWAALGGDGGLTEDSMRIACGLPLRDRREEQAAGVALLPPDSQPDAVDEYKKGLETVLQTVIKKLITDGRDSITQKMFNFVWLGKDDHRSVRLEDKLSCRCR